MRVHIFNSRAPNSTMVPASLNIVKADLVNTNDGEPVYILTLSVGISDIEDVIINNVTKENIKKEIQKAITEIASQINWDNLKDDIRPPLIKDITPYNNQENVTLDSNVFIKLRDEFPAAGINTSSIKLTANNIDITSNVSIKIEDNEVKIAWVPRKIK